MIHYPCTCQYSIPLLFMIKKITGIFYIFFTRPDMSVTCVQASTPVKFATKVSESPELNLSPIPKVGQKEVRVPSECPMTIPIQSVSKKFTVEKSLLIQRGLNV